MPFSTCSYHVAWTDLVRFVQAPKFRLYGKSKLADPMDDCPRISDLGSSGTENDDIWQKATMDPPVHYESPPTSPQTRRGPLNGPHITASNAVDPRFGDAGEKTTQHVHKDESQLQSYSHTQSQSREYRTAEDVMAAEREVLGSIDKYYEASRQSQVQTQPQPQSHAGTHRRVEQYASLFKAQTSQTQSASSIHRESHDQHENSATSSAQAAGPATASSKPTSKWKIKFW